MLSETDTLRQQLKDIYLGISNAYRRIIATKNKSTITIIQCGIDEKLKEAAALREKIDQLEKPMLDGLREKECHTTKTKGSWEW